MKKQLLILTLGASFLLANSNDADLLSQVTNNTVSGSQYELNNSEMEKVDGGVVFYSSPIVTPVMNQSYINQLQNMQDKYVNKTPTSSLSNNTTIVSNSLTSNSSKPTVMTVSQFNSQFKK